MFEFIGGIVFVIVLGGYRALTSDGWDDSNLLNWLRMFSLVCIHPVVFGGLYRLTDEQIDILVDAGHNPVEPFDFIRKDEFAGNFPKTRIK